MVEPAPYCPPAAADGATRYFCTAGRGLERYLAKEVKEKLAAEEVECIVGKVFFISKSDVTTLKKIRSGERLFLQVIKQPPLTLPYNRGRGFSVLKKCLVGEPRIWLDALSIWQNLQHVPNPKQETKRCTNVLKRKYDFKQEINGSKLQKTEQLRDAEESTGNLYSKISRGSHPVADKTTTSSEVPSPACEDAHICTQHDFGFRVSCRCSGTLSKTYTSLELGRMIGTALIKQFGWKAELRNPDLEIFVHLNDDLSVVGFPLLRAPLASRAYIASTGLRSTIAWVMCSLAEISADALVVDPMCGHGTILLEAVKEWPEARYLGIDINDSPLQGASENIKAAGIMNHIGLLKASAAKLPLLSGSVDAIIADIPFGKKFVSIKELLPDILRESERVLRVGGTLVLLLSQQLHKQVLGYIDGSHRSSRDMAGGSGETSKVETMNESSHEERCGNTQNISAAISLDSSKEVSGGPSQYITCLMPVESCCVSLGVTEAVIFKCKKIVALPAQ